jgi:alkylation response protein AidB-like acyl-CoA dehydrogenase
VDVVRVAQQIADEVLYPAALSTDAGDVVPRELLDALAGAGLYGLVAPPDAGGLGAGFPEVCAVHEALASGCLTTAFVWAQHHGLVRALAAGGNPELAASLRRCPCCSSGPPPGTREASLRRSSARASTSSWTPAA